MSSIRLDGKVAIVTGATKGIGRAISLALTGAGVSVVGTARNAGPAAEVAEECKRAGGAFTFVQADVSRWDDCQRTVAETLKRHARVDILINNAGTSMPMVRMDKINESDWRSVIGPTMDGTVFMTRGVLPKMIEQKDGVIINIASGAGVAGLATYGAYCMAKAAVLHHARVVAVENIGNGVRANGLVVGGVATDLLNDSILQGGRDVRGQDWVPDEKHMASLKASTIQPEALANAVMLLCTEEAREINGATIAVDRGFSAGSFTSNFLSMASAGLLPY